MNIFTTENFTKYAASIDVGHGEWNVYNSDNVTCFKANRFYSNSAYIHVLADEFIPKTQYIFSLWLDVDNVYSGGKNVPGGFIVYYSDGSTKNLTVTGNKSNPVGWQQIYYVSDAEKSIAYIAVYYWTSEMFYARWDSSIIEMVTPAVNKPGVFTLGNLHSNYNVNEHASIQRGGGAHAQTFYEI